MVLHSSLSPEVQRQVFRPLRPGGWKVVLATNIAETSITIEEVTHVIDTGLAKMVNYDPITHLTLLKEEVRPLIICCWFNIICTVYFSSVGASKSRAGW